MKKIILSVTIIFCVFSSLLGQTDKIDNYIKLEMSKRHIPGLSIAVVKNGKIIKSKGYGLANIELNVSAQPKTVYPIFSMTKQFTAAAIMLLVEEGKISLDDNINKYILGLPFLWSAITVRHLLTHTSGIKDWGEDTADTASNWRNLMKELRKKTNTSDKVSGFALHFQPGEKMQYCNRGYALLGLIIENVSGKAYKDFVHDRIFHPLHMDVTRMNILEDIIPNRAAGYILQNNILTNVQPDVPFSDGGLISTVIDLANWDAALYTEKILKRSSLEQMWTPAKLNNGEKGISLFNNYYGFGWFLGEMNGHKYVDHAGSGLGFTSEIIRFVNDKLSVIVLTNRGADDFLSADAPRPWDIAKGVASFYLHPNNNNKTK